MAEPSSDIRLKTPDILKGFIIIAIVFVHVLICTPSDGSVKTTTSPVIATLYCGLMVFFMFAGYFYRPGRSAWENIKRRLIQIMPPYLLVICIAPLITYVVLTVFFGYQIDFAKEYLEALKGMFGDEATFQEVGTTVAYKPLLASYAGSYFLLLMMVSFIGFYILAPRVLDDNRKFALTIIVLLAITVAYNELARIILPFYINVAFLATAFMLVGAFAAKHNYLEFIESGGWKTKNYLIGIAVSFIIMVVLGAFFTPTLEFYYGKFGDYWFSAITFFMIAVFGGNFFIFVTLLMSFIPGLSNLLNYVGKHTLAILVLHCFIGRILACCFGYTLSYYGWFPIMSTTDAIIIAVLSILISLAVAEFGPRLVNLVKEKTAEKRTKISN